MTSPLDSLFLKVFQLGEAFPENPKRVLFCFTEITDSITVFAHTADDWSDMKAVVMTNEGMIPSDIWLAYQKKVLTGKRIGTAISNHTSWLGGKIACKTCRRTMTVTKGGKRADGSQTRYFSCTGKSNRICTGPRVTIYADSLEEMADTLIYEKLRSLKACRTKVSTDNSAKINALKNRISEIGAA